MASSLVELLQPQVVLDVISRLKEGRGPLASWLGFQPSGFDPETVSVSGPNTYRDGSVRNVTYRVFDYTRVPMKLRAPGTGPATVAQNPMGVNTVSIARFHQKITLNYEFLGQLSPMIGPNSMIDPGGRDYIKRQTNFLGQQANNSVETLAAGMMRDSLYVIFSGDDQILSFTAPTGTQVGFQISYGIPAGNKGQLPNQMGTNVGGGNLLTVSWDNPNAPIISDIQSIVAAYKLLSRYTMEHVWINSTLWASIVLNTQVRNTAGSANTPFAQFERVADAGMGGTAPEGSFHAILRGNPTIKWHFCDDAVTLGNTDVDLTYGTAPSTANLQKLIPDTMAIFAPTPTESWTRFALGGEYVVENPGMAGVLRVGWYFWPEYTTQPSAIELIGLLNAVPVLYIPAVIAPATVRF
jgi:hypothetical protein